MKPSLLQVSARTSRCYQYVGIEGSAYVCLQQDLLVLPALIHLKGKALGLSPKNLRGAFASLARPVMWALRLSRYVLPGCRKPPILELPFYGHLCLEVHRGYKIFDLRRKTVTKVFKPDVDASTVIMEVERARTAGHYDFAPMVHRWNIEEGWYEEDYVNGEPIISYTNGYPVTSSDPANFLSTYYRYLEPFIESMILSQAPKRIRIDEYVGYLTKSISEKLAAGHYEASGVVQIDGFIHSVVRKLKPYERMQIYIVLSHGDFSHGHVVKARDRLKIIDWEFMSHRSALFDLLSCLLEQLFFERMVHDIVKQVNEAISRLRENLIAQSPLIADDLLSMRHVYRWIFYLEQIFSGTEFPDFSIKPKLKWIEAFNKFELLLETNNDC